MVKRTIETSLLTEPFFLALDAKLKLAWIYLLFKADTSCVVAVVPDYDNFVLKYPIKWEELIGKCGERLVPLGEGRYFIPSLIEDNYGKLSSKCRQHASILTALQRHGVPDDVIATVCRPVADALPNPLPTRSEPVANPFGTGSVPVQQLPNPLPPRSEMLEPPTTPFNNLPNPLLPRSETIGTPSQPVQQPSEQVEDATQATSDTEKGQPTPPSPTKPRARFIPPTVEEVKDYCVARSNRVDPQAFVDHYETCGWKQGKGKPITDWRAAVRTWENMAKKSEVEKPTPEQRKALEDEKWARERAEIYQIPKVSAEPLRVRLAREQEEQARHREQLRQKRDQQRALPDSGLSSSVG